MKRYVLLLFVLLSWPNADLSFGQGVVINEVQSSNTTIIEDESGNNEDWIELYNNGLTEVNLAGYGLSDDELLPYKWIFPSITLGPKEYLLIWASNKNRATSGSPLHTNFRLNSSGGIISLTNPTGVKVDFVGVKELFSNISYGRLPNGSGDFVFFEKCTPKAINSSEGFSELLNPPVFSNDSGFFTVGFNLSITSTIPETTILYTLDGSEPDANNLDGITYSYKNQYPESPGQLSGQLYPMSFQTLEYSLPIAIKDRSSLPNKIASISSTYHFDPFYIPEYPIFKGTVVRAKVIKSGAISSKTITKSYFISPKGDSRFSLPVISLSMNENDLFDYYNGIYVAGIDFDNWRIANPDTKPGSKEGIGNYYRDGDENERVANMTYLVAGKEVLNQDVGIALHGGGSRVLQSKSLGVYARSKYGHNSLDYKFFNDVDNIDFKRLVLRNSGTDFPYTLFRDAFCQEVCKSLRCETESYQPSVIFINGEYWGILNIREKYTDEYFSEMYNIGKDELDFITVPDHVQEGDNKDYHNMVDYFNNNSLVDDANYDYIKTRLDPESFMDFFIANIFLLNTDWPDNNVQSWRKKTNGYIANAPFGHDGRWRWAFHDMDNTFAFASNAKVDSNNLSEVIESSGNRNPPWSTLFLRKLLENNNFKNEFINRFADLMNTAFLPSKINANLNSMKSVLAPEMGEHIARWESPKDLAKWDYYIKIQQDFVDARPEFQREHIRKQFGIDKNIKATLQVSDAIQGYIKINTIEILPSTAGVSANPYPWTGIYFSNIPVKIKAIPLPGYTFSYWSGASTSTNSEITITPTDDFTLTANFVPSEITATSKIIYFWMMDDIIKNNDPLTFLNSTYSIGNSIGVLNYQSCLAGYPFVATDINNYRKADMERRDSPTSLNYFPEANENKAYAVSSMKGIQITQPFQSGGLENNLIFSFSTIGYSNIKFDIAALDEGAATGITLDYSTNSGTPVWTSAGLTKSSFPIFSTYQLIQADFSSIMEANNNPDFKIRLRFTGLNMTEDNYKNVTFNNARVQGLPIILSIGDSSVSNFIVYPNPVKSVLNVLSKYDAVEYKLYSIEGKMIQKGKIDSSELNVVQLSSGLYILKLKADGHSEVVKFYKN